MRGFLCCCSIAAALFLVFTAQTAAQVPVGWQTDDELSTRKADYFALLKANNIDSDRQGIEKYFDNYYFSRWTLPTATGQLRGYVQELIAQDFKDLPAGAREYLLNKAFDTLRKMAADQTVSLPARYNAIYAIGLLNQRDAPNATTPPVPYAPALPYLVQEYEREDVNPDYVRLGALLGIYRHAILGITDAEMKDSTVPALMIKIVHDGRRTQSSHEDEQEVLDCFRQRALDTLGALKSTGSRNEVTDLLLNVMGNPLETIELRTYAARKLADLNFQNASAAGVQINFQRIGNAILDLAKATCDDELKRVEDARNRERVRPGAGGGVRGIGDMGMIGGMDPTGGMGARAGADAGFAALPADAQQEITNTVQRLKSAFANINWGIRGERFSGATTVGVLPMLATDDPVAVKLNDMVKAITLLFKFLDEGPPDTAAGPGRAPAVPRPDAGPDAGQRGRPAQPDARALKVNLGLIRDYLQEFSVTIDAIRGS